jgi:hypothetical protein
MKLERAEMWLIVKDGDRDALSLFSRHYSFYKYKDGRQHKKFIGPGEYLCLITPKADALFVWRKFIDKSGQKGVNCAVFRNESKVKSSELIREAMKMAFKRWPGERLYTYVNSRKIRSSNPGYCFIKAGWHRCGETKKRKLTILEFL